MDIVVKGRLIDVILPLCSKIKYCFNNNIFFKDVIIETNGRACTVVMITFFVTIVTRILIMSFATIGFGFSLGQFYKRRRICRFVGLVACIKIVGV